VANLIHEKCVHPVSKRQFPLEAIREAIKDIHFPIRNDQSAKAQALHCIKALAHKYQLTRAKMRIRLTARDPESLQLLCRKNDIICPEGAEAECDIEIEPSQFRTISEFVKDSEMFKVDVLSNALINTSPIGPTERPPLLELVEGWRDERE
jgi:ribosome maturation protein Sdo1